MAVLHLIAFIVELYNIIQKNAVSKFIGQYIKGDRSAQS